LTELHPINPRRLRRDAEALAAGYPPLLARARRLAANMALGEHGRRQSGHGDEFWQYRVAGHGDGMRDVDWRRSAHSDVHFVRQKEWQVAQSVHLWVDTSRSMDYCSELVTESKGARAQVLGLATAILLLKAGERVGLMQDPAPPKHGNSQINPMALKLARSGRSAEYGAPPRKHMGRNSRALFISDFLGDWDELLAALQRAAEQNVRGCLVQVLDPTEELFPVTGRRIFESMQGTLSFETMRAQGLRDAYLERLAARRDQLDQLSRKTGWRFLYHSTDQSAQTAMLWIYQALESGQ
jgi:MoxR-like ATPase